jgi:hypothetical protein
VSTEVKDDLLGSLDERIRRISKEVLLEHQAREQQSGNSSIADSEDEKLAVTLRRIMAKEFVSIKETALLLNCSDGHIRNLVGKAQKGKASHPIPFLDLDGVTVFPRVKVARVGEAAKEEAASSQLALR